MQKLLPIFINIAQYILHFRREIQFQKMPPKKKINLKSEQSPLQNNAQKIDQNNVQRIIIIDKSESSDDHQIKISNEASLILTKVNDNIVSNLINLQVDILKTEQQRLQQRKLKFKPIVMPLQTKPNQQKTKEVADNPKQKTLKDNIELLLKQFSLEEVECLKNRMQKFGLSQEQFYKILRRQMKGKSEGSLKKGTIDQSNSQPKKKIFQKQHNRRQYNGNITRQYEKQRSHRNQKEASEYSRSRDNKYYRNQNTLKRRDQRSNRKKH